MIEGPSTETALEEEGAGTSEQRMRCVVVDDECFRPRSDGGSTGTQRFKPDKADGVRHRYRSEYSFIPLNRWIGLRRSS